MVVVLGKRKRRGRDVTAVVAQRDGSDSEASADDESTARALFQRAFEAKFKPLEQVEKPVVEESDDEVSIGNSDDEAATDWSGLSDDEEQVEVVEHAVPVAQQIDDMFGGKKAFMSSKPPVSDDGVKAKLKASKMSTPEDDTAEVANLKNDLDLQRLLKESHLLDPSSFSRSSALEGKSRLKALDMRLQGLGAKTSVLQQENMPLSHRRGIVSKSAARESNRRREAAENGVILEKAQAAVKLQKKRERGVGAPGVGKFRGGTLKLSSRDVASIQHSGSKPGRGGRRGGKR